MSTLFDLVGLESRQVLLDTLEKAGQNQTGHQVDVRVDQAIAVPVVQAAAIIPKVVGFANANHVAF